MKRHHYLAKIDNDLWDTIQNLKTQLPESVSVNTFLNKGLKIVLKDELQNLSTYKKNRSTVNSMMSA